jgi:hypothetical protein
VASPAERLDAMIITNGAFRLMREWAGGPLAREYSLSSDWDDRWRTGGSVAEVIEEAHLDRRLRSRKHRLIPESATKRAA